MLKKKKTMPSAKPGHGSKRPTDAQPQNEILRSWGLGGNPQQAAPEAEWLSRGIACYNMFDPKNGVALVMLFSGSNLSYNEEVIGLTGHCLS